MSHNLETRDGIVSYAENGRKERAWHNLGQVFDGPMTVKEALEASRANYKVELRPIVSVSPQMMSAIENKTLTMDMMLDMFIKGKRATVRTDTNSVLGIVSESSYGVVQNEDAFRFVDTLCSGQLTDREHTPVIETAGVLGHGERIFVTAKFREDIILDNKGDDRVEMNVIFTTSHDGTGGVNVLISPVRVVCNNTLSMALSNCKGKLFLKHTSNVMSRLDISNKENIEFAYRALNLFDVYKKSLEDDFEKLRNIKVTEKMLDDIVASISLSDESLEIYRKTGNICESGIKPQSKNKFDSIKKSIYNGIGQKGQEEGNGLWLINGVTTYFQNDAKYKNEEKKFESITKGSAKDKLQYVYDSLMA